MKLYSLLRLSVFVFASGSLFENSYSQTNLVSDIPSLAAITDPNLKDPWGMSFSATSPIWVSDRATGLSTLYTGTGTIIPLVVTVPPATPSTGPTGQVFAGLFLQRKYEEKSSIIDNRVQHDFVFNNNLESTVAGPRRLRTMARGGAKFEQ